MTTFADLQLIEPLQRAVLELGYETPSPIQAQAIPGLLEGRDMLGIAQTGTGKTAAFALPILDRLVRANRKPSPRKPRALVLTPTRELATQIAESFTNYGRHTKCRHTVVFGGVGQMPQKNALRNGVDVLVATPGRLMDHMGQGNVDFSEVEVFVLDEADRMLDMGFVNDVRRIVRSIPEKRQSLLFSATMPSDIVSLASNLLNNPLRVEVTPPATTVERIEQSVMLVEKSDKRALLVETLRDEKIWKVLVFTRTKHGADRVVKHLTKVGEKAAAIHGNKTQGNRERALEGFKSGKLRVLVATDIAARGIDVRDITHVINFDLPNEPESYVHRIGRTARAGRDGIAISFCDVSEREYLRDIEKITGSEIPIVEGHAYKSARPYSRDDDRLMDERKAAMQPKRRRRGGGGGGGRSSGGGGGGGGRRGGGGGGRGSSGGPGGGSGGASKGSRGGAKSRSGGKTKAGPGAKRGGTGGRSGGGPSKGGGSSGRSLGRVFG